MIAKINELCCDSDQTQKGTAKTLTGSGLNALLFFMVTGSAKQHFCLSITLARKGGKIL